MRVDKMKLRGEAIITLPLEMEFLLLYLDAKIRLYSFTIRKNENYSSEKRGRQ